MKILAKISNGVKTLEDFDFNKKNVLVRADFQVPLSEKGEILDDFKIRSTIPTIEYLREKGAKVILISHWKPEGKAVAQSLKPISLKIEELLRRKIKFLDDCLGKKVEREIEKTKTGEILLLENLRFHKEEEANDENFAKALAKLGDIYINDAFGVSHRAHASIVGIPKYLPSGAGLLLEREIKVLADVLAKPLRPLVVIIGGAKISTKIKVIEKFLQIADQVLLGSKIAEIILIVKEILLERKLPPKEILDRIKKINLADQKLHFPTDGAMVLADSAEKYLRIGAIGTLRKEEEIYDIGPDTIKIFSEIIKNGKMIIWNGPVGYFEKPPFDEGTKKIVQAICQNDSAFKIAGGGETDEFLHNLGQRDLFNHVSTGGGAMLEFLSGEKLPGIEALK